jgi:hypothetical protein
VIAPAAGLILTLSVHEPPREPAPPPSEQTEVEAHGTITAVGGLY